MNISELTCEFIAERGKAPRVTVKKRVIELLSEGVIEKGEGYNYKLAK
jgi:hypothetical protein